MLYNYESNYIIDSNNGGDVAISKLKLVISLVTKNSQLQNSDHLPMGHLIITKFTINKGNVKLDKHSI